MRKLVLLASLCVAAAVAAPIASAGAESFTGSCEVRGKANFPALPFNEPKPKLAYKFVSEVVEGTEVSCEGETSGGEKGPFTGHANVEGEGELSCRTSKSEARGAGVLELQKGGKALKEFKFTLAFETSKFGELALKLFNVVKKEETAKGTANFTEFGGGPEKAKTLVECAKSELTELKFFAKVEGTVGE
jgi:hypothetical protein